MQFTCQDFICIIKPFPFDNFQKCPYIVQKGMSYFIRMYNFRHVDRGQNTMTETQPALFDQFEVFVKEYNSAMKTLELALILKEFSLINVENPVDWVTDLMAELYQQATIELIETYFGLALVEDGESWPDWITGVSVEIHEDYLLKEVIPGYGDAPSFIPASVIDPKILFPFKYGCIVLVYHYKETFPSEWPDKPYGQPSHSLDTGLGYPAGLWCSWPYPDLSDETNGLIWIAVWKGTWNSLPEGHWRYYMRPNWIALMTANPDSADYWMLQEVFDCFRQSVPGDGAPWWSAENALWISKGINDDWVDSYDELKNRDAAPNAFRRPLRWLALSGVEDYRFRQDAYNDYVELQMRVITPSADVYGPGEEKPTGGPGIFIPGLGLLGAFTEGTNLLGAQTRKDRPDIADVFKWMWSEEE